MHNVPYAGYYGYQNTMEEFKKDYYWLGMKNEFSYYITRCLECQKVEFEHRHPACLLQP